MMEITAPKAFEFHLWLYAAAESNALEGQHETAEQLRDLAALVLEYPSEFEAYCRLRASGPEVGNFDRREPPR